MVSWHLGWSRESETALPIDMVPRKRRLEGWARWARLPEPLLSVSGWWLRAPRENVSRDKKWRLPLSFSRPGSRNWHSIASTIVYCSKQSQCLPEEGTGTSPLSARSANECAIICDPLHSSLHTLWERRRKFRLQMAPSVLCGIWGRSKENYPYFYCLTESPVSGRTGLGKTQRRYRMCVE